MQCKGKCHAVKRYFMSIYDHQKAFYLTNLLSFCDKQNFVLGALINLQASNDHGLTMGMIGVEIETVHRHDLW